MLSDDSASVLVNFYGPRVGDYPNLEEDIASLYHLEKVGVIYQDGETGSKIFLQSFNPSTAHDSMIIQLAFNAGGPVKEAWSGIYEQRIQLIDQVNKRGAWGISIIYQAEWETDAEVFFSDLSQICLPYQVNHNPLVVTSTENGVVGLIAYPDFESKNVPASVYMVLVPADPANQFFADCFLGPSARYVMPDLICHKGFHQHNQWHNETFLPLYRKRLEDMMDASHKTVLSGTAGRTLVQSLESLAAAYEEMSITLAHLERLSVSLDRQLHNLSWWLDPPDGMGIYLYQYDRLKNHFAELELAIREGKTVWETSQRAVAIINTRLQADQERQQERLTILLAILGVVLAAPQLIDREVTAALLLAFGIIPIPGSANLLTLLITQLVLMIGIGIVLAVIIRLILRRKKR